MKEFIEKLIGRLEEEKEYCSYNPKIRDEAINNAIEIVNQLAEEYKDDIQTIDVSELFGNSEQGNDGWIPCEVELPKISNSYLVTKMHENNGTPMYETSHEIFWISDEKWDCERDEDCEWKVIAWQNKLEPYQPKGE